jgi:ATP-dependent RNA helicase RhlE
MTQNSSTTPVFYGMGIAPKLLETLDRLKYLTPTPIQSKSIPIAIEGKDIIGIAQTGTGKTLAFGIPLIQRLAQNKGRGLVLLPTRELALQVEESFARIGRDIGLRTAVLIGGAPMFPQIKALKNKPHVIVATPGRLIDHLEQRTISLNDICVLVLDEADRMLDMGFAPQLKRILETVPKDRQTLLFSATMPVDIVKIANTHMKMPVRVEIAPAGTASERVSQELFVVGKGDKNRLLDKLLAEYKGTILVFSRTKFGAKKIARSVRTMGHTGAEIHSNRSLAQRREALEGFKNGKYRVLVATDIAARGIDVKGIEVVINYDLPDNAEDYVHRIGRTGRAGHEGRAISFATPDQGRDIRDIERLIRGKLPRPTMPVLPAHRPVEAEVEEDRPAGRSYGRSHGGGGASRGYSRNKSFGSAPSPSTSRSTSYGHRRTSSPNSSGSRSSSGSSGGSSAFPSSWKRPSRPR